MQCATIATTITTATIAKHFESARKIQINIWLGPKNQLHIRVHTPQTHTYTHHTHTHIYSTPSNGCNCNQHATTITTATAQLLAAQSHQQPQPETRDEREIQILYLRATISQRVCASLDLATYLVIIEIKLPLIESEMVNKIACRQLFCTTLIVPAGLGAPHRLLLLLLLLLPL